MEYKGKLYGKISNRYFSTGRTSEEWYEMKFKIKDLESQLKKVNANPIKSSESASYFIIRATVNDEQREYEFPTQEIYDEALRVMIASIKYTDIIYLTGNKA